MQQKYRDVIKCKWVLSSPTALFAHFLTGRQYTGNIVMWTDFLLHFMNCLGFETNDVLGAEFSEYITANMNQDCQTGGGSCFCENKAEECAF